MPKVREVLERIGDDPLVTILRERGYKVFQKGDTGTFDMAAELESEGYFVWQADVEDDRKLLGEVREHGYVVFDEWEQEDISRGYELYRLGRREEFRQWLRDLFWQALGRIA